MHRESVARRFLEEDIKSEFETRAFAERFRRTSRRSCRGRLTTNVFLSLGSRRALFPHRSHERTGRDGGTAVSKSTEQRNDFRQFRSSSSFISLHFVLSIAFCSVPWLCLFRSYSGVSPLRFRRILFSYLLIV